MCAGNMDIGPLDWWLAKSYLQYKDCLGGGRNEFEHMLPALRTFLSSQTVEQTSQR